MGCAGALEARIESAKKKLAALEEELADAHDNREKEHNSCGRCASDLGLEADIGGALKTLFIVEQPTTASHRSQ